MQPPALCKTQTTNREPCIADCLLRKANKEAAGVCGLALGFSRVSGLV